MANHTSLLTDDARPPQDAGRISEVGASEFLATIVEGVPAPSKEEGAPEEKRPLFQVQTQMVRYGGIMRESIYLSIYLSTYQNPLRLHFSFRLSC